MYYFNIFHIKLYLLISSCNYKGNTPYDILSRGSASEQVLEECGAPMINGEQMNDHIEEDDHIDNVV